MGLKALGGGSEEDNLVETSMGCKQVSHYTSNRVIMGH